MGWDYVRGAIEQTTVTRLEKLLLITMANHANPKTGLAWPSLDELRAETGMSRTTLIKSLAALCEHGFLRVIEQGRSHTRTTYMLLCNKPALRSKTEPKQPPRFGPELDHNTPPSSVQNLTSSVQNPDLFGPKPSGALKKKLPLNTQKHSIARFAEFWASYPKRVNRQACEAIWKRDELDPLTDEILADISERKTKHRRWVEGYIVDPERYLKRKGWEDDIEPPRPNGSPTTEDPYAAHRTTGSHGGRALSAVERVDRATAARIAGTAPDRDPDSE